MALFACLRPPPSMMAIPGASPGPGGFLGHKWMCRLETDRGCGPEGVSSPVGDNLGVTSGIKDRIPS